MASRRSRLKAIANLPVRRKPVPVQQEAEKSQKLSTDDDKADGTVLETEEKEQEIKTCEEHDSTQKQDSNKNGVDVPVKVEPEVLNPEVPPAESSVSKSVKSPPPFRFGRRIKPSVSLSFLKERPSREKNEDISKHSEQPAGVENQEMAGDVNSVTFSDNDKNKSTVPELETCTQNVSSVTELESIQPDVSQNELVENISEINVTVEEEQTSQFQTPLTNVDNEKQGANVEGADFNSRTLVHSVKRNIFLNDSYSSSQVSQDAITKQNAEESQSLNNLLEYSLNELPSQNSSQMQCNVTGVRRQWTGFKQKKKYNDFARKVADARREFHRKYEKVPPDRSSLRMIDLIFYNPSTNPMESKTKVERKDLYGVNEELLNESRVDDPEALKKTSETNVDNNSKSEEYGRLPVPQVKIGLNGEIILDEKSLVIETTDAKRGREDILNSAPIYEDKNSKTCYYKRKTQKSRDWSDLETKRFYKALNTIGTDFSLMQKYFPIRSRLELKNKFKREEKLNRSLVDKVLNNPSEFDITQFEKYLAAEKQIVEETADKKIQRRARVRKTENRSRRKSSVLSREITESDENTVELDTCEGMDSERMRLNEKSKKVSELNLLCEKYSLRAVRESPGIHLSSPAVCVHGEENLSGFNSSSRVFTSVGVNELNNANKIRDAFDEIQAFNHSEKDIPRKGTVNSTDSAETTDECYELRDTSTGSVDEFYQAVVSLSASLKSDECKNVKSNRNGKRVRANVTRNEKKRGNQSGRKNAKKSNDFPFMSTLDIETYESDCDNYSSSNESNDNSVISTKTITDQDFIKLLTANAKNMKESKIQFQITEDCSLEKNVEIILDNVPSIAFSEI